MKIPDLTVYLITTGQDINYSACVEALQKQTVDFKLDIIRGYSPLPVAFQQMQDRCLTTYFIEIDEDMILHSNGIEILYNTIKTQPSYAMVCYELQDVNYQIAIRGVKIYNTEIFKKFPYSVHHPSCEVEQLERVQKAGYKWLDKEEIIGFHAPKWTTKSIFLRYYNLVKKQQLLQGHCGFGSIRQTLAQHLSENFNNQDFFGLLGATTAYYNNDKFTQEKNYQEPQVDYEKYKQMLPKLISEYKPLNILFLYDVDGWVFDFETQVYQKYSSHNIIRRKFDNLIEEDLKDIDILLIPGSCHYKYLSDKKIIQYAKEQKIKIVVQYNSEIELDLPRFQTDCNLAIASSPIIYNRLENKQLNLCFIPHFIDTNYWDDTSKDNKFILGWAGNKDCKVKNYDLLTDIDYQIKVKSNYGDKFFKENRSLQEMKDFYKEIGILLILSESEGTPMVLLEAMASGKVVLSTDTGLAPLVLNKNCLIDKNGDIVAQMNQKLKYLFENQNLLSEIGEQNRRYVETHLDWFKNVLWLDKIYTDLKNNELGIDKIKFPFTKIKVINLARIPCANSGYYLSQLINQYSQEYESRYILGSEYSTKFPEVVPFRKFPKDLYWETQKQECIEVIKEADIVHIHHGFWCDTKEIQDLLKDKKVITTIYDLSLFDNTDYMERKNKISTLLTVADQPAQRRIFGHLTKHFLPLVNCLFHENTVKNNLIPLIVYAPTNRYPITNSSSKGYNEVLAIIDELKKEGLKFSFDLIEGVSHEADLNRKRKADIIIDDVINDSWHNTSLHSACFGAIAITGHTSSEYPFIKADLNTLKETLKFYITHPTELKEEQRKLSQWQKENYEPYKLLKRYEDIYNLLFKKDYIKPIINIYSTTSTKSVLFDFLKLCMSNKINTCLLKDTCLEAVKNMTISNSKKLYLGVQLNESVIKLLKQNKYKEENDCWIKDGVRIYFSALPYQTKDWKIDNQSLKVPLPVVPYLRNMYGDNWDKI